MEIKNFSVFGNQVTAIFTGSNYLFYNGWYGFLGLAERGESSRNEQGSRIENFSLLYGNQHCVGGSLTNDRILSAIKRYIRKDETEHGAALVNFSESFKDLSNSYLSIEKGFIMR